ILRIALERLVLLLGLRVRHPLGPAHFHQRLVDGLGGDAACGEDSCGPSALFLGDGDQKVLGGDVLVLESLGFVPSAVDDAFQPRRRVLPGAAPNFWDLRELRLDLACDGFGPRAELGEQRSDDPFLLLEQRQQDVLRFDRLVVALVGERLGRLYDLLRFDGQLVESHPFVSVLWFRSSWNSSFSLADSGEGRESWTRTNWSPAPPPLRCGMP